MGNNISNSPHHFKWNLLLHFVGTPICFSNLEKCNFPWGNVKQKQKLKKRKRKAEIWKRDKAKNQEPKRGSKKLQSCCHFSKFMKYIYNIYICMYIKNQHHYINLCHFSQILIPKLTWTCKETTNPIKKIIGITNYAVKSWVQVTVCSINKKI